MNQSSIHDEQTSTEPVRSAIACNLDADILSASLPLWEAERVEALEWSFDALYKLPELPPWFEALLQTYSNAGRLIGHGVFFSLFSGRWLPEQEQWLQQLRRMCRQYHFDHITEHFGFMTGADFHHGAPLSIPYTPETLAIGRDRLARIYDACGCPVGLENLAFAYSPEEVKRHGIFLEELVAPLNGFIILDLHNLYCQLHNFEMDYEALISLYPLHRVREVHISGGSWEQSASDPDRHIRRDTHDEGVPEAVFALLERTIPLCSQLRYVVMEQLGAGLKSPESRNRFYDDFIRMQGIVSTGHRQQLPFNNFFPPVITVPDTIVQSETLYSQQLELSAILETAADTREARQRLRQSSLAGTAWNTEAWQPYMLETAIRIARKWRKPGAPD